MPYLPYQISVICLFALATGCFERESELGSDAPSRGVREQSFTQQLEAVQNGLSDQVLLEETAVSDSDLKQFGNLPQLQVLLLDSEKNQLSDGAMENLANLSNLIHLRLRGARVNDAGLTQIAASLPNLRILNLPHAQFSDRGLVELARLPKLEQLRFHSPQVTDAGIARLKEFPTLKRLHLIDVPITDAALRELAQLPRLESLYIDGANLSDAALEALFAARPQLHVHLGQRHHDHDPKRGDHVHGE